VHTYLSLLWAWMKPVMSKLLPSPISFNVSQVDLFCIELLTELLVLEWQMGLQLSSWQRSAGGGWSYCDSSSLPSVRLVSHVS
jgi:hypothetical protein